VKGGFYDQKTAVFHVTRNPYQKRKEILLMAEKDLFMKVEEVAKELGISKSHAYKIMQKLNAELKEKGFLTVAGRVNRKYFMEKFCYGGKD
jgi:predicted ArsR family transcriptional regulator